MYSCNLYFISAILYLIGTEFQCFRIQTVLQPENGLSHECACLFIVLKCRSRGTDSAFSSKYHVIEQAGGKQFQNVYNNT